MSANPTPRPADPLEPAVPQVVDLPGLRLTGHRVDVPLDHGRPEGERLTVFAREVAATDGEDKPFLVFLQGGPGGESPRPDAVSPAWLPRALQEFRVLLLDQRGTGLSSPVGTSPDVPPQQQAERLAHFRADAIVADCEVLRAHLGVERWSLLGQSFGGFCALRYLSTAPHALREVLFAGGVPAVGRPVDDVYRATWALQRERNERFRNRYPGDRDRLRRLLDLAGSGDLRLADGEEVTPRRLRSIGSCLGMSDGPERLHYLLERDPASTAFVADLGGLFPFDRRNPLYAVVHESSYADGGATRWSAHRTMPEEFADDETLLFGEHVLPWTCRDASGLAPLAEAADLLAEHDWPRLYDERVLASVDVPCAAAVYAEDPYVPRVFSEETAELVPTLRTWVDPDHEHNGLRADGARILDHLLGMVRR